VDTHPDPDLFAGRPLVGGQGLLGGQGGRDTGAGRGEDGEEAVALGALLLAAVGGQAGPDEGVVVGQDLDIGVMTQAPE
jgi:hypothetical protein